jgi:hypothetical protein
MMATKFLNILVITIGNHRKLAKPLNSTQIHYLNALEVNPRMLYWTLMMIDMQQKNHQTTVKKGVECTGYPGRCVNSV